jgi:raffinose/stachyose/melibiose transport system substrate-binding protein
MGPGSSGLSYLGQTENTTISGTLKTLSGTGCATAAKAAPLSVNTAPGASFDQKLQLLGGQDALPNMMMAAGTPALMKQFISASKLEDLTPQLDAQGVSDQILPAAKSTLQALYGSKDLYALPTEFNIEGIWYNKKLFADNGISVPTTWDQLVAASAKLKSAGLQPISADGKDGWNITRYIGDYIFRSLGPDALQKVADGTAKLTDPEYVKAADAVGDLGKAGAFGDAVGSVDYNTSMNTFLTGKAAMLYMGSWALANFNDPKQNTIGADNIGFMPFPAVTGGAGNIDQMPSNVGVPVMFASKNYGTNIAAWVKCIAADYGTTVLKDSGVISGFKSTAPANLPALTKGVQDAIAKTKTSVLWFEALFSSKATTISQNNAPSLVNGSISGQQFMQLVQAANAAKN